MSNSFGHLLRVTTFGESHGPAIGCVIDGCPPGLAISEEEFARDLERRATGRSRHTSQRHETDAVEILSGVYEGRTTGTPIALLIRNNDARSKDYNSIAAQFRPAHADYTYWQKYGHRDPRGGGRSSARETTMRVAAAVIAKKWLAERYGVTVRGHLSQLGEPVYDKLDADLAKAMMSINAVKGVEIGDGFAAVAQKGSFHRDEMTHDGFLSNHAGGILGGISSGQQVVCSVAFKPTSSLRLPGRGMNVLGEEVEVVTTGRHDPCVGIRATPICEAMMALVLMDQALRHRAQCGDVGEVSPRIPGSMPPPDTKR